jgi:hypothetical protein
MAKSAHADVLDGLLNQVKTGCTKVTVCTTEPTTYAQANATNMLANVTVESSDFTLGSESGGRSLAFGGKSGVLISNSGTAEHIAFLDVANSKLLAVTTCTSQALTANGANTVAISTLKFIVNNPT